VLLDEFRRERVGPEIFSFSERNFEVDSVDTILSVLKANRIVETLTELTVQLELLVLQTCGKYGGKCEILLVHLGSRTQLRSASHQ